MVLVCSLAFPLAFGSHESKGDVQPAAYSSGVQYGVEHIENRVQQAVFDTVLQYVQDGVAAFDALTPDTPQYVDAIHPFVLDMETLAYVADASALHERGEYEDGLERGDRSLEHILGDIRNDGGTWFEYLCLNPGNGEREFKRVWLQEHDGYLFGAGYFLPGAKAQEVVHEAVELYVAEGSNAFDIITPDAYVTTAALYAFVVDASSPDLLAVAHGAFPDRIGRSAAAAISGTSDRPFEDVVKDLDRDGSTWVEYVYVNPDTNTDQLKRTWLYQHDGFIFASGYYVPDVRLQTLVDEAMRMYNLDGEGAFEAITPDEPVFASGSYQFVMDGESLEMEAHGALPYLVGSKGVYLDGADKPLRAILDELDEHGDAWVAYVSENPGTRTDQLTRAYLRVHDGYVFGASYSFPDSRALSKVDEAIYTYRAELDPTFATISSGALNERDLFPVVKNATNLLAHGTQPFLAGSESSKSHTADIRGHTAVYVKPPFQHTAEALEAQGQDYWYQEIGLNTNFDLVQIRNNVARSYGDFVFHSGYFVVEGGVQSKVDLAIFSYNENGRAAFDAITPDAPVTTDESYPFVLDADTLEVVAYGASPDKVGAAYGHTLSAGPRSLDGILADIEADGHTWVIHTAVNPATGYEQLKRSWLEAKDGYIFGAGYYVPDSNVRDVVSYLITMYEHAPHVLGQLRTEVNPAHTGFIADPATGLTLRNNPSLQWAAITAEVPADDIRRTLENEQGMWVTYQSVNPLTGEEEERRVWMALHGEYVFGRGYYKSTPLPTLNLEQ